MICFRDMTFCTAPCGNSGCHRRLTIEVRVAAEHWWGQPGAPIAVTDFSRNCPAYQPEEQT